MIKTDRIVALAIIGISIFLFMKTGSFLDEGADATISAAFFPRFILAALVGCSIWLMGKSRMAEVSFPAPKGVILGGAQIFIYVLLINPLGYFIVTPLFLFFFPASLGYRKWGWLTGVAVGGTLFSYIIFLKILGVPLPMGIMEQIGELS